MYFRDNSHNAINNNSSTIKFTGQIIYGKYRFVSLLNLPINRNVDYPPPPHTHTFAINATSNMHLNEIKVMVKLVHTIIIITVVLSFSIIQNYLLFVWGGLINRGMLCYAFIEIGIRLTLINYKGVQS